MTGESGKCQWERGSPCRAAARMIYGRNKWDHCRHGNRIPVRVGGRERGEESFVVVMGFGGWGLWGQHVGKLMLREQRWQRCNCKGASDNNTQTSQQTDSQEQKSTTRQWSKV